MFDDTAVLIEWLRESARHLEKTKTLSKKTRAYRNGDQLDGTIKRILANRGQPEQYENQIAKHHNAILGFKKDRQVEIKLFGRQQRDQAAADMLNAIIKALTQESEYENTQDALDDDLAIEGIGVAELRVEGNGERDRFGREHKDVEPRRVDPQECYLDPFSRAKNYNEDARYLSRCFWVDKDELLRLGFDESDVERLSNHNYLSDIHEDDLYADETIRDRVLLTLTWYRRYDKKERRMKVYYCFWSDTTILMKNESPYRCEGFPYEVEFMHRDHAGEIKYWGLYRDIIPIQDHINYAKLRLQNMLANNKTLVERTALVNQDIQQFTEEWNLDNATVEVLDIEGVKEIKQNVQIQQILNIIIDGRNQISELLNSNREMLGTANNRMSGVGQERRIETGLVGLARFTGSSDRLQKRIIRKAVALITQYYDTERVVSIIDEDYVQQYVTINAPVVNAYGGFDFEQLENGKVRPVVTNSIAIGKYDLIFDVKPRSASMSEERMRQNVELMKVLERTDPSLISYLLPDMLRDHNSATARRIKAVIEEREAQHAPMAQQEAAYKQQIAALEMRLKRSQSNLNDARAASMMQRNQIDLHKAFSRSMIDKAAVQTKRDKVMLDAQRRIR